MALRDHPYLPLFVDDYLSDEKLNECSASAVGVYSKMLCILHKSEEYGTVLLKQKDKQNKNICLNFAYRFVRHMPWSVEIIEEAIKELVENDVIQIEGDKLSQKRMVRDNIISIKRALAGKKGGNNSCFAKANAQAKTQANSGMEWNGIEYNDSNKEGGAGGNNGNGNTALQEKITRFWEAYPKKKSLYLVEYQMSLLNPDDQLFESILEKIEIMKKSEGWKKEGGKYIPYPSNWLAQKGWLDEPEPEIKKNPKDLTAAERDAQIKKWIEEEKAEKAKLKGAAA